MFGTTETLAIAAGLLVIVASLPARGQADVRLGLLSYLAALCVGALLVFRAIDASGAQADTRPSVTRKYAAKELSSATEQNVLLIDGGSYALNAVDVTLLEGELRRLGFSVRAVKLTFSAANHFERFRLYEDIKRDLAAQPRSGQRWLFLLEAQEGYDHEPLAQFDKNQDTARAFHYVTPSNAWFALAAQRSPGVHSPPVSAWRWGLARHMLINAFNVGVANRLVAGEAIEDWDGGLSGGRKRFRFSGGLKDVIAAAERPGPDVPVPPWIFDIREARLRSLWRSEISNWVYFGVPATHLEQQRYVRSFCNATHLPCIAPDVELLSALDKKSYWMDRGHVSIRGARVYTEWLARRLVEKNVLLK
jgi:hypothetical protein